jgi:hypothetical protein
VKSFYVECIIVPLGLYTKDGEMTRACSTHMREEECIHVVFWKEIQKERDNQEDLDVGVRIFTWK